MQTSFFSILFVAVVLPSLRIFPLLNRTWSVAMAAIVLLHTAVIVSYAVYIQSIGSGMNVFSDIYTNFFFTKSSIGLEEISLLFLSLVPVKPQRLTKKEKQQFTLSDLLKQILVGLMLGDLNAQKRTSNSNVRLRFEQGLVHEQYLMHLFELFKSYCLAAPKTANRLPDKRTGNIYTRITFTTFSLPCFNELYNLFYLEGVKIIPSNIGELLTGLSLAYWLHHKDDSDDGTFVKGRDIVIISTNSYSESDVDLLITVLSNKLGLKCRKDKHGNGFRIVIVKSSLSKLRELVQPHLHSSMLHKIGL